MHKREAKDWVTGWASTVIRMHGDCDTILYDEDGRARSKDDVARLQGAVRDLCAELDASTQRERLR